MPAPDDAPGVGPVVALTYRATVDVLCSWLDAWIARPVRPDVHTEALGQLRGVIERIIVMPTDAGLEIELVGEIARMIRFSPGAESLIKERFASFMRVVAVESGCGAVALGRTYLFPPLSSGGASLARPWLRLHTPLIEPDMQISRIRLSDKNSLFRVQRLLQFLTIYRS